MGLSCPLDSLALELVIRREEKEGGILSTQLANRRPDPATLNRAILMQTALYLVNTFQTQAGLNRTYDDDVGRRQETSMNLKEP